MAKLKSTQLASIIKTTIKQRVGMQTASRIGDGGGLWLQVKPNGTSSWLFIFKRKGKERQMGLGPFPAISLAKAREKAAAARVQLAEGIDPLEARCEERESANRQEAAAQAPKPTTFEEAAKNYVTLKASGWRNAKHAEQWTNTLATYAMPVIGKLPVSEITTPHILAVLSPIWNVKPETASRVRGRIKSILDAEKALGHRTGDNPAAWSANLAELLPKPLDVKKKKSGNDDGVRHMPALPYAQMPTFMALLAKRNGISARALEVLILTATRTGSLIGMRDDEVDFEAMVWTIPGERMKRGRKFRVPLSQHVARILRSLPRERGNPHVFAGLYEGTHISNMSMLAVMKDAAPGYVPHGFRSTFTDWASDTTHAARSVIEMSMAHSSGATSWTRSRRTGCVASTSASTTTGFSSSKIAKMIS